MHEFLTHFCTLASSAILSQSSKFCGNARDAVVSSFQLHCAKILTLALSPDYATLLPLGKFDNYIATCNAVLTQYMAAVEQEQDEIVCRNSKWNPFGKKGSNLAKPSLQEEVAQYVKDFLAQAASPSSAGISASFNGANAFLAQQTGAPARQGPVTCYNCNKLGNIAMFCQAECVECGDIHAGACCQVCQDHMERRQHQQQDPSRQKQPESMLMEMMAVEKHTITPPVHPKPNMARPVHMVGVAHTSEKVFPDPSCHCQDKIPVTYAQAAAPLDPASTILNPVLHGKRDLSSKVFQGKYKKP
ncbi:hypothetical protein DSO57_1022332 [Entomophthora muscae]|uniref:Uncharacterized protein n=1 Tax=Entomophthora muscae TaxID=34485 RepID=A0ACC2T3C7_9FUNG|nr:hypothetical protein DSO57_1022332 [Entomophthora muscae]